MGLQHKANKLICNQSSITHERRLPNTATGIWFAISAFLSWGILPLYWKALKQVSALQILAHRFIWSFIFVVILLSYFREWNEFKAVILQRKKLLVLTLSSILICANWGIYIWAINSNHVVDASLGYYINPLLSICLGMLILREKLNFWQLVALLIATAGVLFFAFEYGKIPWIALSLAITFGLYGLAKKKANIGVIIGLASETMLLTPLALGYLLWLQQKGLNAFGNSPFWVNILLAGAGIVTALPLLWFARAAQSMPLTVVGFTQYLTPTITLLLGLFLYHEPFTFIQLAGFAFIWLALLIFSCSQLEFLKKHQPGWCLKKLETDNQPVGERP